MLLVTRTLHKALRYPKYLIIKSKGLNVKEQYIQYHEKMLINIRLGKSVYCGIVGGGTIADLEMKICSHMPSILVRTDSRRYTNAY